MIRAVLDCLSAVRAGEEGFPFVSEKELFQRIEQAIARVAQAG
jgi:hypothetical protein